MPADTAPPWDGRPQMPEVDAFHWLLKRNAAWAEAWLWQSDADGCGTEYSGAWAESDGDGQPDTMARWYSYLGPCLTPSEVTAREAAAWAAGAAAMREAAEASADCGCDVRAIVLERLASHGLREAERCCGQHYDACCALTAAALRALPIPPMPTQGGNADE